MVGRFVYVLALICLLLGTSIWAKSNLGVADHPGHLMVSFGLGVIKGYFGSGYSSTGFALGNYLLSLNNNCKVFSSPLQAFTQQLTALLIGYLVGGAARIISSIYLMIKAQHVYAEVRV